VKDTSSIALGIASRIDPGGVSRFLASSMCHTVGQVWSTGYPHPQKMATFDDEGEDCSFPDPDRIDPSLQEVLAIVGFKIQNALDFEMVL
jgi:hypothetical protein